LHFDSPKHEFRKSQTLPTIDLGALYSDDAERESFASVSWGFAPSAEPSAPPSPAVCPLDSTRDSKRKGHDLASFHLDESSYTTVMVRNIPCKYKQSEMVEEVMRINENFDFLYLPPARTARIDKNLGYCFINFRTPADAQMFMLVFQEHQFSLYTNSTKRALVIYADLQGFEDNLQYYRKSKVTRSKFRPYISN
jgi:hypothetical protein